jgi:hypothetical protein
MNSMTGRVLSILKEHGEWNTIEDIHILYSSILDYGFDPDDMSHEELAQTAYNLRRYELFGKTAGYVWDLFYKVMEV